MKLNMEQITRLVYDLSRSEHIADDKVIEKYFKQSPNEVEIKLSLMRKIAKGYDIAGYYTKKLRQ